MATASGHTRAILASKVQGTAVYNAAGEKIGHIEDVVLDKLTNNIMFAILGFGGVLGMGEKFHSIPWSLLDYDEDKGGYVVPVSNDVLKGSPAYTKEDLTRSDGNALRAESFEYYNTPSYW